MDRSPSTDAKATRRCVGSITPKLVGSDAELGNFILGVDRAGGSGNEASRALLREVDGVPNNGHGYGRSNYSYGAYAAATTGTANNVQDWGRKYLATNGGCCYIDLDHFEVCTPEVLSALDHVAASHAMLKVARSAMLAANAKLPDGQKLVVMANNSDGYSHSYGSHLNILIGRRCWNDIFQQRMHPMLFELMAYQVSSIIFTGQGKVGAENGQPPVPYQISQRADFFETLVAEWTTTRRPLVNCRDEALCGTEDQDRAGSTGNGLARFHSIFFDHTLCHVAAFLRTGVLQIVLAMIEGGWSNPELILEDPLGSVHAWSHDPDLVTRRRLCRGKAVTAVELQLLFLDEAKTFVESGRCVGAVPDAGYILEVWEDTLLKLDARDFEALSGRLDWVLKRSLIERVMRQRPELSWDSPEVKSLDLLYSNLDEESGLYWICERAGAVERLVTDEKINRFVGEPPENTRAWTRAMVLRNAGASTVQSVDWDGIRFRWPHRASVDLANPLKFTKAETDALISNAESLEEILEGLDACAAAHQLTGPGHDDSETDSNNGNIPNSWSW